VKKPEIVQIRMDTAIGMVVSQVITFFIVICAAGTLNAHGMTDINTAQDAAKALLPLGGKPAYWLFTLGMLGAGMLGIPTMAGSVAYALAETAGWRYGLYRRFNRAKQFYGAIAAVVIIGFALNFVHTFSPVKGLLYAAVINGVVAPPLIVILMCICNNRKIVKGRVNSALGNAVSAAAALLMAGTVVIMIWAMCSGKV
jgi:Mn2+/Fe2+ NRAMP family transporter